MKRFNWTLSVPLVTVAGLLVFAACEDPQVIEGPQEEPLDSRLVVENDLVFTPSGVVFTLQEWNSFEYKSPWLVSLEEWTRRVLEANPRKVSDGDLRSVTGNAAPTVLCHTLSTFTCNQIQLLIPGTTIVLWTDAQFIAANVAAFAAFDLIYLGDRASSFTSITNSRDVWGTATTGRLVLTGVHFEHCAGNPTSGPCTVLKASVDWIHAGSGTGLLLATQFQSTGPLLIPTVAPYGGVTYASNGGGHNKVRIVDPGHFTMQGSTDSSLSNFMQSSHSFWGGIGGFTNVAEVCDDDFRKFFPDPCLGAFHPHFLVTSVAVADQDGDGVPDNIDNCPTVANEDQTDANGNGVGDACESAPTVTISPSVVSVAPGGSVTFTTTVTDADDPESSLTYEWRVDAIIQLGETGTSFTSTFNADATVRVTVTDPGLLKGFDEAEVTIITNQPPDADAGPDQTLDRTSPAGVSVLLDGTASSDPDGDALTFSWTGPFGTVSGATPTVSLPLGVHTITLTVDDGNGGTDTDQVQITVENVAPTANAGPDQTLTGVTSPAVVTLSGSGADVDGTIVSFDWSEGGTPIASGATAIVNLTNGPHTITLTVEDDNGATGTDDVLITVDATLGDDPNQLLEDGVPIAGIDPGDNEFPPGTFVEATFVDDCHEFLIGQVGRCLDLAILDENGNELGYENPVTIGLCFPNTIPLDERENLAIFRFDEPTGKVTVLQEVDPDFVDCDEFIGSAVDPNPFMRFAKAMWRGVKNIFSPEYLMAFGDGGFGGLSPFLSFFVWAELLDVDDTKLHLNAPQSGKDWYTISGTFDLEGLGFNPAVDIVKVQFGDTDVETIPVDSFKGKGKSGKFTYTMPSNGSGISHMVIESDGSFSITTKNMDLADLDQNFIPFCLQIGDGVRGRTQGVGLEYEGKSFGTNQGNTTH